MDLKKIILEIYEGVNFKENIYQMDKLMGGPQESHEFLKKVMELEDAFLSTRACHSICLVVRMRGMKDKNFLDVEPTKEQIALKNFINSWSGLVNKITEQNVSTDPSVQKLGEDVASEIETKAMQSLRTLLATDTLVNFQETKVYKDLREFCVIKRKEIIATGSFPQMFELMDDG
ncbi:MAG: hypothetical protein AB8E15_13760 [Bdellovibrionales bacterium]